MATITLTLPQQTEVQSSSHIMLKLSLEERVLKLLKNMESSQLFSQETLEKWKTSFLKKKCNELEDEKKRELISDDLCFLLVKIISSVQGATKTIEDLLDKFAEEVEKILKETLPDNENVTKYIDNYAQAIVEIDQDKSERMAFNNNALLQVQTANILATQLYQLHLQSNDTQMKEIHKLFEEKKASTLSIQDKMDSLNDALDDESNILGHLAEEVEQVGAKMQRQELRLQSLLKTSERVLKEVK